MKYLHKYSLTACLKKAGFSLTELMAVAAVLSVLAVLATPVVINRVEQAKISAAQDEAKALAEAMEMCGATHGYYVPLQVLDDPPASIDLDSNADAIDQEVSIYFIDPSRSVDSQISDQASINDKNTNMRVANLINKWQGPFVTFHRYYIPAGSSTAPDQLNKTQRLQDFPLDPWGNPYYFYSPQGIIGSGASGGQPSNGITFSDGQLNRAGVGHQYGRYAIVSYGPDGVSQTIDDEADDIIYMFGPVVHDTSSTPVPTPTPTP